MERYTFKKVKADDLQIGDLFTLKPNSKLLEKRRARLGSGCKKYSFKYVDGGNFNTTLSGTEGGNPCVYVYKAIPAPTTPRSYKHTPYTKPVSTEAMKKMLYAVETVGILAEHDYITSDQYKSIVNLIVK